MALNDFLSGDVFQSTFPSMIQTLMGISRIKTGTDIAQSGYSMQAEQYMQQAVSSIAMANYNVRLDQNATTRNINEISANLHKALGTQATEISASGFKSSSPSNLDLKAEALNAYATTVVNLKADAKQRQEVILYQGKVAAVNAENSAKMANYQSSISTWQGNTAMVDSFGKLFTQGYSLLSSYK